MAGTQMGTCLTSGLTMPLRTAGWKSRQLLTWTENCSVTEPAGAKVLLVLVQVSTLLASTLLLTAGVKPDELQVAVWADCVV